MTRILRTRTPLQFTFDPGSTSNNRMATPARWPFCLKVISNCFLSRVAISPVFHRLQQVEKLGLCGSLNLGFRLESYEIAIAIRGLRQKRRVDEQWGIGMTKARHVMEDAAQNGPEVRPGNSVSFRGKRLLFSLHKG